MMSSDDYAAAGRDRLRAGDADRERVVDTLKTAFVDGRLTSDELDTRTGRALVARTYADLAALTSDIPPAAALPVPAVPARVAAAAAARSRRPARRRHPLARAAAQSAGCLAASSALWLAAGSGQNLGSILDVLAVALFVVAVAAFGNGIIKAEDQRRTRRALPSGSGPGGPGPSAVRPAQGPAALGPRAHEAPADERARKSPEYRQRRGPRSVELRLTS